MIYVDSQVDNTITSSQEAELVRNGGIVTAEESFSKRRRLNRSKSPSQEPYVQQSQSQWWEQELDLKLNFPVPSTRASSEGMLTPLSFRSASSLLTPLSSRSADENTTNDADHPENHHPPS